MVEEDAEAMQHELKEAFRLYDKEGKHKYSQKQTHILNVNIFSQLIQDDNLGLYNPCFRKRLHFHKNPKRNPQRT